MNVVEVLRKHGLSKAKFAADYFLSRPTLDDYISRFESGSKLPKKKYQIIFDSLFTYELDDDHFSKEYATYKHLINRDKVIKLDDFSPEVTDKIFSIIRALKESALKDDHTELINFVSFVALGFNEDDDLAKAWVLYFNELNGLQVHENITDRQMRYLGNFYELNRNYIFNDKKLDISKYSLFIKRKDEIKQNREHRKKEIQEKVSAIIKKRVEEEMRRMSSDTSDDEIVKKIVGDIQ